MKFEFALILPCYNEAKSLVKLSQRAIAAAQENGFTNKSFQLILVENGSRDNSKEVMADIKSGPLGPWIQCVPVSPNLGYGNGIYQGLKAADALFLGWSHADEQCDPGDAFKALGILRQSDQPESTLVKGHRHGRDIKDRIVSAVFKFLARCILWESLDEINAQPKVFHHNLLSRITKPPPNFAFDLYVLYQAVQTGYRIRTLPVLFPPRIHGVSNWASSFAGRYKTILGMIAYMFKLKFGQREKINSTEGKFV